MVIGVVNLRQDAMMIVTAAGESGRLQVSASWAFISRRLSKSNRQTVKRRRMNYLRGRERGPK